MLHLISFKHRTLVVFLMAAPLLIFAQPENSVQKIISGLIIGPIPSDLLATKTIALYDPVFTTKELEQIQSGFEQTGIDAVVYYPMDLPLCNRDVQKVFSNLDIPQEVASQIAG